MSFCPKIIIHGGGAAQVHMGGVATVEVGTVTTGAPGTEAQVTNSGTRTRAVLNFAIPRGADGNDADVAGMDAGTTMTDATVLAGSDGAGNKKYTIAQIRAAIGALSMKDGGTIEGLVTFEDVNGLRLASPGTDGGYVGLASAETNKLYLYNAVDGAATQIKWVAAPSDGTDAANKAYVDSKDAEVVTVTQSVGSDGTATYTADKTFAQLMAAYTANRPLQLIFIAPAVYNAPLIIPLIATDETAEFGFATCITVNDVVKTVGVQVANTGSGETWTCSVVKASDSSDAVAALGDQIGDLADLETTDKSNLVKAVNEAKNVQPDWSQNDATAKDYVKNRPCYKTVTVGKTYATETFTATSETQISGTLSESEMNKIAGSALDRITIDGTPYAASAAQNGPKLIISGANLSGEAYFGAALTLTSKNTALRFVTGQTYTLEFKDTTYVTTEWTRMDGNYIDVDESLIVTDGKLGTATGRKYVDSDGKVKGEVFNDTGNVASGADSHAEGSTNTASGANSHAEGTSGSATGMASHSEGSGSQATNTASHAEGWSSATNEYSHSENYRTSANGKYSHAEGEFTTANGKSSHVQGKYNIADSNNEFAHIVGNGTNPNSAYLSNAHTLDWSGNAWFAGNVYVGSTSGKNRDEGSKKLATEEYVNDAITAAIGNIDTLVGTGEVTT